MSPLPELDRRNLWGQTVYADLLQEVDPFRDLHLFRPLNKAYDGNNTFWSIPSPEPNLDDDFWRMVQGELDNEAVRRAAAMLAAGIEAWEPNPDRLAFAAILRAGVPIADWLCRLLPGSVAVSLSLFVGLGIDLVAVRRLQSAYPDRKIVFVDGWTGRGGVARVITGLGLGPLAVLNDPWGWADFCGIEDDIFCPSACFTGVATLGFSRTFFVDDRSLFAAYRFPEEHCHPELVRSWQQQCPSNLLPPAADGRSRFFQETDLRIHSNEVCRALINAAPLTLYFADDPLFAREHFGLLHALAERRGVPVRHNCRELAPLRTRVACSLDKGGGEVRSS